MKIKIPFKKDYIALFSNIGNENEKDFYLLMVYHKSMKGGFDEPIEKATARELLGERGFNYIEV